MVRMLESVLQRDILNERKDVKFQHTKTSGSGAVTSSCPSSLGMSQRISFSYSFQIIIHCETESKLTH